MSELKDIIEYAMTVSMDDTNTPDVIMQGKEEEFIAIRMCDVPYAESEGYKFYGTLAELM